jgi:predicted phosphodiesterase
MKFDEFLGAFRRFFESSPVLTLGDRSRCVFLSDLHMGDGGPKDDLAPNRDLLMAVLGRWYLERGYTLILGGDIEDLQKFPAGDVAAAWQELYGLFDAFASRNSLWKLVGNHDLGLLDGEVRRYPLHHGLRLERNGRTLFCFHGHQASGFFVRYAYLGDLVVRFLAKPLKIRNSGVSGHSRRRFKTERRIYKASKRLGIVSLCGHTHRPLFESLSKYDRLRWEIEELVREFPTAPEERKIKIAELVDLYRTELERASRKELRWELSKSLYEDSSLLIPCLFNSGCATGRTGITALEIEDGRIGLVHWTSEGRPRPYLEEEALRADGIEGTGIRRFLLRQTELDRVFARIDLLGGDRRRASAPRGDGVQATPDGLGDRFRPAGLAEDRGQRELGLQGGNG